MYSIFKERNCLKTKHANCNFVHPLSFFRSFLFFILFLSFPFFRSFSLGITWKLYGACVLIFYQMTALLMEINSPRTCFELHPCELQLASYAYKTISKEALQSRSRSFLHVYSGVACVVKPHPDYWLRELLQAVISVLATRVVRHQQWVSRSSTRVYSVYLALKSIFVPLDLRW